MLKYQYASKECATSFFALLKMYTLHVGLNWLHSRKSKWHQIIMCSYLISTLISWELWLQFDCKSILTLMWAKIYSAGGYMRDNLRQDLLGTNHEVKLKMVMWWSLESFFFPGMRNSAARWSWWWLACVACMGSLRIKVEFEKARLSMEAESRGSLVSGFQDSWISGMIICTTPHHISGLRCWSSKLLIGVSLS